MNPELLPCIFFDRDGVVNRSPGEGYILTPDQFELNEGIAESLRLVHEKGALAILVTSQKGVGKGLMTRDDLDRIHGRMTRLITAAGGTPFDAIYTHTGEGMTDHPPKPNPGMIFSAAERFSIDLRLSWMIGDADRDIEMGQAAGLAGTVRIRGEKPIAIEATHTLESTTEIPVLLESIL